MTTNYLTLSDIQTKNILVTLPLNETQAYYFGKGDLLELQVGELELALGMIDKDAALFSCASFHVGAGKVEITQNHNAECGPLSVQFRTFGKREGEYQHVGNLHGVIQVYNGTAELYDFSGGIANQDIGSRAGTLITRLKPDGTRVFHALLGAIHRTYEGDEHHIRKVGEESLSGFPHHPLENGDILFLGYSAPAEFPNAAKYLKVLEEYHKRRMFYGMKVDIGPATASTEFLPKPEFKLGPLPHKE